MKSKARAVLTAAVVLLAVACPMFAHHSASMYDREHPVTVSGNVTEYRFLNPHVEIYFEVKDESGKAEIWIAESGPPQKLFRTGWNAKTLKPGDRITVTGHRAKDGRRILSVVRVVGGNIPVLTQGAE